MGFLDGLLGHGSDLSPAEVHEQLAGVLTEGEIVQVGSHEETNIPVYLVEFGEHLVVGCLEEEIVPL